MCSIVSLKVFDKIFEIYLFIYIFFKVRMDNSELQRLRFSRWLAFHRGERGSEAPTILGTHTKKSHSEETIHH